MRGNGGSCPARGWQSERRPKIVSKAFGRSGDFAYDESGDFAVVQGVAWLPAHAWQSESIAWAYVGLFNSLMFESLLDYFCPKMGGGQYEIYRKNVLDIPVPSMANVSPSVIKRLSGLAKSSRKDVIHLFYIGASYLRSISGFP